MRLGIYGRIDRPVMAALHVGAVANEHYAVLRSMSDYTAGQTEDFDAVFAYGLRGKGQILLDDYTAIGIPVFVVDFGYLRRVNLGNEPDGYWQMGLGGLNKAPHGVPGDRFALLGIECQEPRTGGDIVAVFGQVPCDASHMLDVKPHARWARETVDRLAAHWRPHPRDSLTKVNAPLADGPLDALWPRLARVETLCSTSGLDALIAGVPAVAHMPERAIWGHLSGETHPGKAAVQDLCERVAYAQWTRAEMASGEAIEFALRARWDAE